jgi:hypothetical protein
VRKKGPHRGPMAAPVEEDAPLQPPLGPMPGASRAIQLPTKPVEVPAETKEEEEAAAAAVAANGTSLRFTR